MLSFTSTGTELRRFRRGLLPRLAVGAMILVPLLYGALYLWAFWDPTGNMDRLPVALVNSDTGATLDDEPLAAGQQVTDKLVDSADLDWRLTDAEDAAAGVADGTYYFAVTIPADFSTDVASAAGDTPTAAQLDVTYNDANSFLASTLGKTAMAQVQAAVGATIGDQAVDTMLVGLGSARDGFATASDGALTLRAASGDLSTGAHQVADGAVTAADGAAQLATGSGTLATGTDSLASGAATLASGASTLSTGAGSAAAGAATLSDGAGKVAAGAQSAAGSGALLAAGASEVADGVDTAVTTLTNLDAAMPGLEATLNQVAVQMTTLAQGGTVSAADAGTTLTMLGRVNAALPAADPDAAAELAALQTGAHQLDAGASALSAGLGTLSSSTSQLATGASSLANGAQQVATGAAQLATGASTLSTGATTLQSGSHTVADGATALATGTATLADGATQVADGTDQVGDGAQQLADGLADGAAQIPDDSDSTRATRAEVISSPVSVESDHVSEAEGFGEGFAPFFIPLALFVGALITWLLLRPVPSRALATPVAGWRTALAGYLPALAIGVGQVAVMIAVIHWGVGLQMSTALGTVAFTLLVAATFLALQQMLMAVLGPAAGKVAILALLMLQLASSGGTYPVETTPVFFRAIHPVLPMSYAVTGLRQTITGGADGRLWLSVGVLAGVLLGSLAITAWRSGRLRTWSMERLHPALSI